ncbi:MAG TPA: hypothetical protein VM912_16125 [Terriglobales bacterium]|nr:hypothetical protein [Terriglobales bacterium]
MTRQLYVGFCLAFVAVAIPLRAANAPLPRTDRRSKAVWSDEGLSKLHVPGLISVVGREEDEEPAPAPSPYVRTQDPTWYAQRAATLRYELENRQAQLRQYQQALDDARNLRASTGGIDLVAEDFAIAPEAGMDILRQRLSETQSELDALEDLARHNAIEPGTLRGQ